MSSLGYEIVDVFTDRPFTGNPLAVVFGADALAVDQMQAVAREFNLSETVFVLPPGTPDASYRVRIFTPEKELPFAGHPSVGAAVTAGRRGLVRAGTVIQQCGAGLLPVELTEHGYATLRGGEPTLGAPVDPAPLLAAVGLTAQDHTGPAPRRAGCGLEFDYLCVRPDALPRARLDPAAAARGGVGMVSVLTWAAAGSTAGSPAGSTAGSPAGPAPGFPAGEPEQPTAHCRVFCPGAGVTEDPATGSAALGLGVWAVGSGLLPANGQSRYLVRQGVELGRPSTLDCTVTALGGRARSATVAGQVVPVASGQIAVPPFVG
ncbi:MULTISPECIES: PhzF family phenazine biosynthesis protein [unclassified Solwaraspora]|uniref:PhzF family phenazine biosynthesis protein n=1 Tax=unclassified Solwaraspora TaxID=2627926 RepID=UPI00248AF345|nr:MULTISPECIES: PhzF family phenazine biosynthesis protein [unclassified Solwaraspora]WBB97658.1 PhzF family phenazine biosynthesis protein [Solwaraspora sp. WMMA2059]WBC18449.1 PhzF family phenazine biosynthesis protein [Solwaraspora sp. WMMA2080]WJK34136.1 PhzF family phenazine biosynthesis protein [Solwaraspora sp. WMMA2065]